MALWQLQTAKQKFSEVIRAAEAGEPQIVTKNGREVAAIIDIDDYRKTHQPKMNFVEYLLSAPQILEEGEDFEDLIGRRQNDPERNHDLFD